MTRITKEKIEELKATCASFLKTNGINPKTQAGAKMIHAFWYGALAHADDHDNPYVVICLLSGRHQDLITPATTKE